MRLRNALAATAAFSLMASATAAAAQSARPLGLAQSAAIERAGGSADEASDLRGRRGGMGWILGLVAIGILVFVIVQLQDDNALPTSP